MSSYSLDVKEIVEEFNGTLYQIIEINVRVIDGKFLHTAMSPHVSVFDSSNEVESFKTLLSGNQKEIRGFFTTEAFSTFPGLVTILFDDGSGLEDTLLNIDINNLIKPLDPLYYSLNASLGDNAWLDSIS